MSRRRAVVVVAAAFLAVIGPVAANSFSGTSTVDEPSDLSGLTIQASVLASPVAVDVSRSGGTFAAGRPTWVSATVVNHSDRLVSGLSALLVLDGPFLVLGETQQNVGDLRPRGRQTVRWSVCGLEQGSAIGLVEVDGGLEEYGELSVVSSGFVLTATEVRGRSRCGP